MEPRVGAGFLALVSGFWFVEELAPVVLVSFGDFWIILFALVHKGTFGGFGRNWLIPELRNPPLSDIGALVWELLQAFENAQEILCDVGMGVHRVRGNEGTESA